MKIGRDVEWIEWPSWKRFGQSVLRNPVYFETRSLMREVLDKLDGYEGRLSELLIDSATDESEANSPIKMTPQEGNGEVVYMSRTR